MFLSHSELSVNISNVQAMKKSFVRRFWNVSGREIVWEVAPSHLEEVCFHFGWFLCHFFGE